MILHKINVETLNIICTELFFLLAVCIGGHRSYADSPRAEWMINVRRLRSVVRWRFSFANSAGWILKCKRSVTISLLIFAECLSNRLMDDTIWSSVMVEPHLSIRRLSLRLPNRSSLGRPTIIVRLGIFLRFYVSTAASRILSTTALHWARTKRLSGYSDSGHETRILVVRIWDCSSLTW